MFWKYSFFYSLWFDFALLDKDNNPYYFIEYNGKQHYDINDNWYNQIVNEGFDLKQDYAKEHNIPLLVIKYDEDLEFIFNKIDFSNIRE